MLKLTEKPILRNGTVNLNNYRFPLASEGRNNLAVTFLQVKT